ncbi:Beta-glucuronidase [Planctomycetes bacterium Poly30]|uniref:Beta-glucuronidase n=1 Tax=Saltatorellus ferox TaxID=2528018 RepID=A0A518F0B2_9BACT|nr:Beta-glucuronidase [Planctomycetes bacterium Poly30]
MNHPRLFASFACALFGSTGLALADVTLPAVLGNHGVLQAGETAAIWGWAAPGEAVTVTGSWTTAPAEAVADDEGRWRVEIPLPEPGGPYSITIEGQNRIVLEDMLVGEVWICSGQSNMEMGVGAAADAEREIAAADHPGIRLFRVPQAVSARPLERLSPGAAWTICSPDTIAQGNWGGFSAVGYYFGRRLNAELGVPIGLIHTNWGGTPAESWTPADVLEGLDGYEDRLAERALLADAPEKVEAMNRARLAEWESEVARQDAGYGEPRWYSADLDDSEWATMDLPVNWSETDLRDFDGVVWYRKNVSLPQGWRGKELVLELGPIDDEDRTWVGETQVGEGNVWNAARRYSVPASAAGGESVVVTVRVLDKDGPGGIFGSPDQMALYAADAPGERLSLAGPWRYRVSSDVKAQAPRPELLGVSAYGTPASLYNAMIHPLVPFGIQGAIWYQGEANATAPRRYEPLFRAMIEGWRSAWKQPAFPFYYAQIAPFLYWPGSDSTGVREAQRRTLDHPNVGMVVTSDIGNLHDIHPQNKQDVGLRLANVALAGTYGREVGAVSGPIFRSMQVDGERARLTFDHAEGGLSVRPGTELSSFELAGADGIFLPAEATLEKEEVVLHCSQIPAPVAARYAWSNTSEGNLMNGAGLPASCFSTIWNEEGENRNTALVPMPKWGWWWGRHQEKRALAAKGDVDLVFIGDSITHAWEDAGARETWNRYYGRRRALNLGFSGDRTENVLWRLQNGELDGISPKVAVVMIGTNNTDGVNFPTAHSAEELAEGIVAVCKTIRVLLPNTQILLLAPFPYGETPNPRRATNHAAGQLAAAALAGDERIRFADLSAHFLTEDETIDREIMPDFLHPGPKGQAIWAQAMEPLLSELLGDAPVK